MHATIYDMVSCYIIADGVEGARQRGAAIQEARQYAARIGRSVIVEDRSTRECYRVTPKGDIRPAPEDWVPCWEEGEPT